MSRAGRLVTQSQGYRAFFPAPLPPSPPLAYEGDLVRLLSDADQRLARLDGVATTLPNADLFVAMYVRQEAVLSSQIEGTQSTLEDVLQFEIDPEGEALPRDVGEVVNYVAAMNHGLKRLAELPLSLREQDRPAARRSRTIPRTDGFRAEPPVRLRTLLGAF